MTDENTKRLQYLKSIVSRLPESPGCYQYLDNTGMVIYVGKAKNLKRRVASYFHQEVDRFKTKVLVSKICDIKYTVVKSDQEAFLLENSLIKKYSPRYNVLLKDGKTYPYICVTKEDFPRIMITRRVNRKTAHYYGPFSHLGSMHAMLNIIVKIYKPRKCKMPMTCEGVCAGKYKTCLEWHIHNCKAPCTGKQSQKEYLQNIAEAKEILSGNTRIICRNAYDKMQQLAQEMRFEEAEEMKQRYMMLTDYCSHSEVVSNTINDVDVFSIESDSNTAYVNFLHVVSGSITQAFTFEYKKRLDESDLELLQMGIIEIRSRYESTTHEIIVPYEVDMEIEGVIFSVPQRGDRKKLLDLSLMNCKQYRIDRLKQAEKLNPEQKAVRLMKAIQTELHLPQMPVWIECFDNSHISGTDAVAGLVVFRNLKPSKKDYRHFIIKSATEEMIEKNYRQNDDYASMREVVMRRYSRLKEESVANGDNKIFPDLIITDGGKGQMSSVKETLNTLGLDIPIAGLAKDNRHRTNELLIFNSENKIVSIGTRTDSELFHLLARIQDEVHRYAITFHRERRSLRQVHSQLDEIKGIGEKTKQNLLKTFHSVKQISSLDLNTLENAIGKAKAKLVFNYFSQQ